MPQTEKDLFLPVQPQEDESVRSASQDGGEDFLPLKEQIASLSQVLEPTQVLIFEQGFILFT